MWMNARRSLGSGEATSAAWKILVRRYQTEATQIAQVITRDRALAEDVVQSAFVRVYGQMNSSTPDRPFAPWFFRISQQRCDQSSAKFSSARLL